MRLLFHTFFSLLLAGVHAAESWTLLPEAKVTSEGVFLSDVLQPRDSDILPRIKLTNAPAFGSFTVMTRADVLKIAAAKDANLQELAISGVEKIRIVRTVKILAEEELKDLLTEAIQSNSVKERGELEVRFVRSWTPLRVPDEPLTIKLMELP